MRMFICVLALLPLAVNGAEVKYEPPCESDSKFFVKVNNKGAIRGGVRNLSLNGADFSVEFLNVYFNITDRLVKGSNKISFEYSKDYHEYGFSVLEECGSNAKEIFSSAHLLADNVRPSASFGGDIKVSIEFFTRFDSNHIDVLSDADKKEIRSVAVNLYSMIKKGDFIAAFDYCIKVPEDLDNRYRGYSSRSDKRSALDFIAQTKADKLSTLKSDTIIEPFNVNDTKFLITSKYVLMHNGSDESLFVYNTSDDGLNYGMSEMYFVKEDNEWRCMEYEFY